MMWDCMRNVLSSYRVRGLVRIALLVLSMTVGFAVLLPADSAKCDDLGCDYNPCDSKNPCNRGCRCVYPQGASVGYCVPWYQR